MTLLTCSNCGKNFNKLPDKISKNNFCSSQCYYSFLKKQNEIIVKKDYAIIKISNRFLGPLDCLIDIEDIEKIKNFYWNVRYDKRHPKCLPYVESHKKTAGKQKRIHLHRLIMNCPDNMVIDHINGNNLDNRKNNLRIVSQHQNLLNKNKAKNIYYNKRDNLYTVQFRIKGKTKYLCYTRDLKEAEYYANIGKKLLFENKTEELLKMPCKVIQHSYDHLQNNF